MPSPFPGMDPYLERHWSAVHTLLIAESCRVLNRGLPDDLSATVEERVVVDSNAGETRSFVPDAFVIESTRSWSDDDGGTITIDAPIGVELQAEPAVERYVRIVDTDARLITVIEFVSPANKLPAGIDDFRRKRSELVSAGVHFVEIDLVRAGDWKKLLGSIDLPPRGLTLYRAVLRSVRTRPRLNVFPIRLQDPLPDVPIPLRVTDSLVYLPLQKMIQTVYEDGRYGRTLKYDKPLDPPLDQTDASFAAAVIQDRAAMVV